MTGFEDKVVYWERNSLPSTIPSSWLSDGRFGDQDAWTKIANRYFPMVYGWCRKTGLQPADAADVTQDVFRSILQALPRFTREKENATFRGWIRRITQRRIIDFRTRRARQGISPGGSVAQAQLLELTESPAIEESHPDLGRLRLTKKIHEIQGEFESATWQAFIRSAVDGCNAADIARELGISVNAVYVAKSRVLKRLRTALSSLDLIEAKITR